ncbi:Rieske (2Fe-2S) protein [Rhodobacteraceae bacterium NNCM2]|nr:Rieske (2Fe-2S) protein [Coraliihabitans acroporae]
MDHGECDRLEDDAKADHSAPNRREVIGGGAATIATIVAGGDAGAAGKPPEKLATQPGDRIQIIKGEFKGEMLRPEMLVVGEAPIEAFPFDPANDVLRRKNRLNRLIVLRLDPAEMDGDTAEREVEGVLAYSAICTHRGCTINSWKPEERHLRCHCHLSEFDALSGGSVIRGPAKRQLAMVPLGVDEEGYVVAMDGFTSKVGGAKK